MIENKCQSNKRFPVRIINIMTHTPAYDYYKDFSLARKWWVNNQGVKLGIWGYDWLDLIGEEIISQTNKFIFEVWQPDTRADKVYSFEFESGLVHRLFPATLKKRIYGLKIVNELFSKKIIEAVEKHKFENNRIIVLIDSNNIFMVRKYILHFSNLPFVLRSGGTISLPLDNLKFFKKNFFSIINKVYEHFWIKKNINKIDGIIYQNNKSIDRVSKIYANKKYRVFSGCDYSTWKPNPDKILLRKKMKLPLDKPIFLIATFFKKLKQVDKLISVFTNLSHKYDFQLIIAGHGPKEYETYLHTLAEPLIEKERCQFVGYIRGDRLIQYYNTSDYYLLASTQEGASNSVLQAFACEKPVISTKVGGTAELMSELSFGCLLDIYDYEDWEKKIDQILEKKIKVTVLKRERLEPFISLKKTASDYIRIFETLIK